jgi:hypothetical protein
LISFEQNFIMSATPDIWNVNFCLKVLLSHVTQYFTLTKSRKEDVPITSQSNRIVNKLISYANAAAKLLNYKYIFCAWYNSSCMKFAHNNTPFLLQNKVYD